MEIGAHMLELRRIRAGIFSENDKNYPSINIFDFVKAVEEYKNGNEKKLRKIIIPAEVISDIYLLIEVKKTNLEKLFTGKPILKEDLEKIEKLDKDRIISVFSEERFIGMYKVVNESKVFAKPMFVLQPIKV